MFMTAVFMVGEMAGSGVLALPSAVEATGKLGPERGGKGIVVCWLFNVPATRQCISGTDVHAATLK